MAASGIAGLRDGRGYDQSRALAAVAASMTGLTTRPAIDPPAALGAAQATLGQVERRANVRGAFAGIAGSLRGLHVGLIDDRRNAARRVGRGAGLRDRGVRAYVAGFGA
jgi:hypothetical protein